MSISRRGFLGGLVGVLAAGMAPAIIHNPMKIVVPSKAIILPTSLSSLAGDFDGDTVAMKDEYKFTSFKRDVVGGGFTKLFYPTIVLDIDGILKS